MDNKIKKTILLVEDEEIISMAEEFQLSNFGYKVISAATGEDAVRIAVGDKKIDLILMDIDLGRGISGPEAAVEILKMKNIPIVFLTAHIEKEYVEMVKKITRYGYILKNSGNFVLQSSIEMAFELFEANEKARENENRYRVLVENSINGIALHEMIFDKNNQPIDYIFLQVNTAFEKHTGLHASEILNKRVTQVHPGIEKTDLIQIYGKVVLTGEPVSFETFFEPSKRYFNITAYQAGNKRFAVVFENITDWKNSELAMKQLLEDKKSNV